MKFLLLIYHLLSKTYSYITGLEKCIYIGLWQEIKFIVVLSFNDYQ